MVGVTALCAASQAAKKIPGVISVLRQGWTPRMRIGMKADLEVRLA